MVILQQDRRVIPNQLMESFLILISAPYSTLFCASARLRDKWALRSARLASLSLQLKHIRKNADRWAEQDGARHRPCPTDDVALKLRGFVIPQRVVMISPGSAAEQLLAL